MAYVKLFAAMFTVFICCGAAMAFSEQDYADLEIPGLASPVGDLEDIDDEEEQPRAAPTPCTFPAQWESGISAESAYAGRKGGKYKSSTSTVFVDSTNHRVAAKQGCGNWSRGYIVLFGANNTADLYAFLTTQQKCFHKKLQNVRWSPQQIPPNATYVGTRSIGPTSGGLSAQLWSYSGRTRTRQGQRIFIRGSIMVASTGCVPVLVQNHGVVLPKQRNGQNVVSFQQDDELENVDEQVDGEKRRPRRSVGFEGGAYFFNFNSSIADPSVFTPPKYCNTTSLFYDDSEPIPEILEKFIDFQ